MPIENTMKAQADFDQNAVDFRNTAPSDQSPSPPMINFPLRVPKYTLA